MLLINPNPSHLIHFANYAQKAVLSTALGKVPDFPPPGHTLDTPIAAMETAPASTAAGLSTNHPVCAGPRMVAVARSGMRLATT
jgi:hypothetical protein